MAIIAAAVIGAAATAGSAAMASKSQGAAAKGASQTQSRAGMNMLPIFQPWMNAGMGALSELQPTIGLGSQVYKNLASELGIGGDPNNPNWVDTTASLIAKYPDYKPPTAADFTQSPGYQYQINQMRDAVQNSALARGGFGGNTLSALQTNAQGLAAQDWWNFVNNWQKTWALNENNYYTNQANTFQRQFNLADQGLGIGQNVMAAGFKGSEDYANILSGIANSQAAGQIAQGNANASRVLTAGNALDQAAPAFASLFYPSSVSSPYTMPAGAKSYVDPATMNYGLGGGLNSNLGLGTSFVV